jgi:hypothetical protein
MRRAVLAVLLVTSAACTTNTADPQPAPPPASGHSYDLAASRAKIARIQMSPNTAFLKAEEREAVNLLIQAAELMNPIYLRQRSIQNATIRAEIARSMPTRRLCWTCSIFTSVLGIRLRRIIPSTRAKRCPPARAFILRT